MPGIALLLFPIGATTATAQKIVALELVLAVDTSTSVNESEFLLQKQGIANAFRHPAVLEAIRAAGDHGIAVTVVQWSGQEQHETVVDWMLIRNETDAKRFAAAVDGMTRRLRGLTDIGGAIRYSLRKLENNGFIGEREVIDISGDGTNGGPSLSFERDRAIARNVTINGLVILEPDPDLWEFGLLEHYVNEVVAGLGSFVMTAQNFDDFANVIRRKLIREIGGLNLAFRIDHLRRTANANPSKIKIAPPAWGVDKRSPSNSAERPSPKIGTSRKNGATITVE